MNRIVYKDEIGKKYGKLKVLSVNDKKIAHCICDCGNEKDVSIYSLRNGNVRSCGCLKSPDIAGQRFGHLVAIKEVKHGKNAMWECQCDCGNKVQVRRGSLTSGNTTSCGCIRKENLTGKRFGRLVAIRPVRYKNNELRWECRCDCGKTTYVIPRSLKSGNTTSCGCGMEGNSQYALKDMIADTRIGSLYREKSKNNSSGHVGVYWNKLKEKWYAKIWFQRKQFFLGYYDKYEEACLVREKAEEKIHGGFLEWYAKEYQEKAEKIKEKMKKKS